MKNSHATSNKGSINKGDRVKTITLNIDCCGKTSRCSLDFDDLTIREMYDRGFCGPVSIKDNDGNTLELEVDVEPALRLETDPDAIRGLSFAIYRQDGSQFLNARVKGFSYRVDRTRISSSKKHAASNRPFSCRKVKEKRTVLAATQTR